MIPARSLLGWLLLAVAANATPVTWNFSGQLTFVDFNMMSYFSVGDSYSGTFTFESDTPFTPYPDDPSNLLRYQSAVTAFDFVVGSYAMTVVAGHDISALVQTGQAITFATNGDENDALAAPIGNYAPKNVSLRFAPYAISDLAEASILGAPSPFNTFQLSFTALDSNQSVTISGSWPPSQGPGPAQVPDEVPVAALLLLGAASLSTFRAGYGNVKVPMLKA